MTVHRETSAARRQAATKAWLFEVLLVVCTLSGFVAIVAPTLGRPLLERHAFRQTQTAFQARVFYEEGIDLAHPKVPVLGEPFEIPFEFPLLQAGASLVMDLGVEEDASMRLSGLACFLATALLLYGLVRRVAGPVAAGGSLLAFVLTPFALVWSRTSMIEFLATAGAVGFTWALVSYRESRRAPVAALALIAGLIGMLVKPTTAIFWIIPGLLYRPEGSGASSRRRRVDPAVILVVCGPIAAALLWTRHADAIKAKSPTTSWLTSGELRTWNFGTLGQRLDPYVWQVISERVAYSVVGLFAVFLPVALVAAIRSRQWPFWVGIASAALLPPLVFTNLYFVHDYYLAAVTPAFAALAGFGIGYVWSALPRQRAITVATLAIAVAAVFALADWSRGYWQLIDESRNDPVVLPLAREIAALTRPDDYVAVVGLDWSPAVLYYAHRRGHMVPPANEDFAYDLIRRQGYRYLTVASPATTDLGFLSRWRWVGSLGAHTYAIASSASQLPRASFLATNVGAFAASGTKLVDKPFRMRCNKPHRVPSGARGSWIRLQGPPEGARFSISRELAPLPARATMFVTAKVARGSKLTVTCTGAESLLVAAVVDGGPPRIGG